MRNDRRSYYPVVVVSDLHLGSSHSRVEEVKEFLDQVRCDTLLLNGDILDVWQVRRGDFRHWDPRHTDVLQSIVRKTVVDKTRVIYLVGNHDAILLHFMPLKLHGIEVKREFVLETCGRRYLVVHGDIFDTVEKEARWLSLIGDKCYDLLLKINRWYNRYREHRGLPYRSISQPVKQGVKRAVSFISHFEESLTGLAQERGYDGVICGHIHQSANTEYEGIHYLNSGDWVESLSALTLDAAGEWRIYDHQRDFAALCSGELDGRLREVAPKVMTRFTA